MTDESETAPAMPRPSDPTARIKLLAAAEAVFVERGLDGAKVEDITRRAAMSKGAFYLHFESKEQAFRELVEGMVARLATFVEAACEGCDPNTDVAAFLDHWVNLDAQLFEFIWQNKGLIGLLLEGGSGATFRYLVDEFADRASAKTRAFLEEGIRYGIYRSDLDLDLTAEFISGAYDRFARRVVKMPRKPEFLPLMEQMQHLVVSGIGTATFVAKLHRARTAPSEATPAPPSRVTSAPAAILPDAPDSLANRGS
jgi:AcrR family transcriptional regulator